MLMNNNPLVYLALTLISFIIYLFFAIITYHYGIFSIASIVIFTYLMIGIIKTIVYMQKNELNIIDDNTNKTLVNFGYMFISVIFWFILND